MTTTVVEQNTGEMGTTERIISRSMVLNWEVIAYIVIFGFAIFTRFYMLGERTMSHDESLHTAFSEDLYSQGRYVHNPMMHGPILFHATALSYALFGVNDFTSRVYPAVLGVMMVMFPLLFRRWLGRTGAILVAVMLLISPLLLYYNRYIRHDTPSIVSGLLMFWASMMYISGPPNVRRKAYWLYIIAAAMLWNLGSKETAFIYIAIFGSFLTLYWLVRVAQHYLKFDAKLLFYVLVMAILMAGVMALAMTVVLSISLNQYMTIVERLDFVGQQVDLLVSGKSVSLEFLTFLAWSGLTFVFMLLVVIGTGIWAYRRESTGFGVFDGVAGVVAIGLVIFLTRNWSHRTIYNDYGEAIQQSTTAASLSVGLIASISLLLIYAALRIFIKRSFLGHFLIVLLLILGVFTVLIVGEEYSRSVEETSSSEVVQQPDPLAEDGVGTVVQATTFKEYPFVMVWGIAAVAIALILTTKSLGWWGELRHFPEFDVLLVMGSLVLPWLTAVFIEMAHSTSADWVRVGESLRWLQNILPVASAQEVGQFAIGLLAFLPMAAIAITAGLAWNWRRWLIASAVFHILFALFFTTVFSNIQGLASGMIYSLQYWLEQQGVRRGSQPQYYYTNVVMPMYEFLPIIGSILAMAAGWLLFWRKRLERDEEVSQRMREAQAGFSLESALLEQNDPDESMPADSVSLLGDAGEDQLSGEEMALAEDGERAADPFWSPSYDGTIPYPFDRRSTPIPRFLVFLFAFLSVAGWAYGFINMIFRPEADLAMWVGLAAGVIFTVLTAIVIMVIMADFVNVHGGDDPFIKYEREASCADEQAERAGWRLDAVPFLLFVGWWAVFNLFGYTLAGEKMPWLGTHITVPMILLAGWYFGRTIERIEWAQFLENGWLYLFLLPLTLVAFFQIVLPILGGQSPFGGVEPAQLRATNNWIAAVLLFVLMSGGAYYVAMKYTGWAHLRRTFALVVFVGLAILTFRSAWMANFINYDLATEFLVYAHAGPANKDVVERLMDVSEQTEGGLTMRVMYDSKFSWPGSWYMRDFHANDAVIYIGANTPTQQQLEGVAAVLVGPEVDPKVAPLLADAYQRFEYVRMWWPMQDYFNLSAEKINNLMDFSAYNQNLERRGLFDIWWSRDYTRYEDARRAQGYNTSYSVTDWPVSDPLYVYIRKDIAAEVWQYGIGDATAVNPFTEVTPNLCLVNYQQIYADEVITDIEMPLNRPMGLTVQGDRLYVANDSDGASRVNIFTLDGQAVGVLGSTGNAPDGAYFMRPNSVAVDEAGNIYVVDTWNFRVRLFDADQNFIQAWGQAYTEGFNARQEPYDGFWGPRDIAVDELGRIYVSDTGNKRIRVYSPEGTFLYDFGYINGTYGGAGDGQLNEPSGIAIYDGLLYVADTWNQRLVVFDIYTREFVGNYALRAWADGTGGRPYLAVDGTRGAIYVTDPDAKRVLVLNMDGSCVGSFGGGVDAGMTPDTSQFGEIGGIAVDDAGSVYVSDVANNRVMKFQPFPLLPSLIEGGIPVEMGNAESTPEVMPELSAEATAEAPSE